ncbi:hypothetical protein PVAP13_6KG152500, partial [Panicum virgatum]
MDPSFGSEYLLIADSVEQVPDVVPRADVPDAGDAMRAVSESVVPDAVDEVPDSVDDDVPDAVEDVPDAVKEEPDVDEVVNCPRCRTFHAGGVFGGACRQARRNARRCARCGLLHEDYDLVTQVLDGMENLDCKFYIPVVEELQLEGNTIILPEQVVQKLDEMNQPRKSAKANKK